MIKQSNPTYEYKEKKPADFTADDVRRLRYASNGGFFVQAMGALITFAGINQKEYGILVENADFITKGQNMTAIGVGAVVLGGIIGINMMFKLFDLPQYYAEEIKSISSKKPKVS